MEKDKKYEWGEGVFTLLSWFKKERVKNARVLVAGAGALGNEVVKNLALFGVGHIYVVDFDRIELSNLTRSVLFREEDAYNHSYKAEIVAKRAREINPQIKVTPIVGNLFSEVGLGLYRSVDVVIGCLDSRIARYLLNRLSLRAGKSWIDGSIENLTGVVKVYTPGMNCYECGLSREEFNNIMLRTGCADVVRTQSSAGRVATTPISASIVGALGLTNMMNIYRVASWKNTCPAHEQWNDIKPCQELTASMTVAAALKTIKKLLGVKSVEINMRNNKFIDKIISDRPEKEFNVMIPESKLDDVIKADKEMRQLSYRTLFHKNFYENIDKSFPYQELTLQQIGIPPFDVLQVSTEKGGYFVELTGDAPLFE